MGPIWCQLLLPFPLLLVFLLEFREVSMNGNSPTSISEYYNKTVDLKKLKPPPRPKNETKDTAPKSTTEAITTTPKKLVCQTFFVNAKAAVIRDRFQDLISACPDLSPGKCREHVDYAVRLGCIGCKKGITQAEQNVFLEALREWVDEKLDHAVDDTAKEVYAEFEEWKGTNIEDFLKSKQQTINKIEPGGFRYVTVPKDWAEEGLHMLVQDCGKYGQFASAFHKGTVESSPLEEKCDWEKKFVFLEACKFAVTKVVDKKYTGKDAQDRFGKTIRYGTFKWNGKKRVKEDHINRPEDVQAHKFKYGWSDPIRENELVGESVNNYERVKLWGRYTAPPEQMYENYNSQAEHFYEVVFKSYEQRELPNGNRMTEVEFENAKVDMTVEQMLINCDNIIYMTPRFNAIRRFDYTVQGQPIEQKPEFVLQTYFYKLDDDYYEPANDYGQECVLDPVCLADVNIFKYKDEELGK